MENGNAANTNYCACGNRVTSVRVEWTENGWVGKCPRCAKVDDLIEELIRKQLREGASTRFAAMTAVGGI